MTTVTKTPAMKILELERGRPIRDLVLEAISTQPNFEIASQSLGISRQSLYLWMKSLGIAVERYSVIRTADDRANLPAPEAG